MDKKWMWIIGIGGVAAYLLYANQKQKRYLPAEGFAGPEARRFGVPEDRGGAQSVPHSPIRDQQPATARNGIEEGDLMDPKEVKNAFLVLLGGAGILAFLVWMYVH